MSEHPLHYAASGAAFDEPSPSLKIYRRATGELVENPDPLLVVAAERALAAHRSGGRPRIEFTPPQQMPRYDPEREYEPAIHLPIFYVANPDYRTWP